VGNGIESLSDSNICEFLESRQQQGGVHSLENSESSRPNYEWQILCGKAGGSSNIETLAETVNLFTVCAVLALCCRHVNALQFVIMNVFDLSVSVIELEVLLCCYIFLVKLLDACVTEEVLLPLLLAIEATCFDLQDCLDPIKDLKTGRSLIPQLVHRCVLVDDFRGDSDVDHY